MITQQRRLMCNR